MEKVPTKAVDSHCPYCALQCGMKISVDGQNLPEIQSRDFPTNKGGLCRKGWTSSSLFKTTERITQPLVRNKHGEFEVATWDEALDVVAKGILDLQQGFGKDAVSVFGGGGLTNEKAYSLGKFARRVLGTRYIDYNGRFCMAAAAAASQLALGIDRGLPFPLTDIPLSQVALIAGSNPATTMPPVMQHFEEQQKRGGKVIVVDPRVTATARLADLHLQNTPGSDAALFNGILHLLIKNEQIDREYIEAHTRGFEAVEHTVKSYWPDRVERITGVPVEQLELAVSWIAEASSYIALSGRGVEQQINGVNNDLALININLALGQFGKQGSGYGCMTGQGNGQGGREHGQKADQLPGYRRLDDAAAREWIAKIWDMEASELPQPGVSACEMFDEFSESIRACLIFASNPAVSFPNVQHAIEQMNKLDLLVVTDSFMSETAALADVVLPTTQWAEELGTMTNLEGRVILRQPALNPPTGVLNDIEILSELAARLGAGECIKSDSATVFAELCYASRGGKADYAGMSYERIIQEDGVFWPCPSAEHPGTPRLFTDGFYTEDQRGVFHAVEYLPPSESLDSDFTFFVTTGRLLQHYQSGAQTRRIAELSESEPSPYVEINSHIAANFDIADQDMVRVVSRRGSMVLRANLTADIRMDTLFIPFHWGGKAAANILTSNALEPRSRIPEFKFGVARIEKVSNDDPELQKIN